MEESKTPVVKRSLFSWILPGNIKLQVTIVLLIAVTVFTRVFPLEMQKRIVNEAINLKQIDLLLLYSGLFLVAVLLSSFLKFLTNILHTLISQRVLAKIRKEVYHHILTLPINFFRKTGPGMVVASILTELAPAGEFAGVAIATPLTSVLTLLAFAGYLFWLNPLLAIVSLCIYPFVLIIVPMLQKRANIANKKRVDETRKISNKITEAVTGIHEIHGNGSYHIENEKFDGMVDKLLIHRMFWSIYKQSVKIVNNLFNNLSPFLIFLLGGYLTIKGRLELGALVAFLSAQERLYDPWREVIDFYQLYQDASVRYDKIMNYFDVKAEHLIKPITRERYSLDGSIEIKNLSFETEDGISLIEDINLFLKPGEHLALIGFSGSGKSTLAQCVGQLYKYTSGNLLIGEKEVSELTKYDIVNNVGFVAQAPFIFDGTIEENLLYSCEALRDGDGSEDGINLPNRDEIIEVLQQTGVFADILRFGLNTHLIYDKHKDLVSQILRVREKFQRDFGEDLAEYVEFFNEDTYLYHSNVSENLIFGTPKAGEFHEKKLLRNEYFMKLLDRTDLTRPLLSLGDELSRQTVDILGSLEPDKVLFEQSPINPDELDDFKIFVERTKDKKLHQLGEEDSRRLLDIALRFTPGKHKMIKLPRMLETLILEGRAMFREKIHRDNPDAVSFFNISEYIHSQTILNNILFGKTITERAEAQERIVQSIIQLLIEEDLLETIVEIGMQFEVGSRGDRLSGGQRQKVAIARAFLKSPKILIMDEATSGLDNKSQARIQNQLETRWKGKSTVIAVVHRLDITKNFDKIAVLKAGKIVEMGTYNELFAKKGVLHDLVVGKK